MGDLSAVRVRGSAVGSALLCAVACCAAVVGRTDAQQQPASAPPGWKVRSDFFNPNTDGSFQFGYSTGDAGQHYHSASATPDGTVTGVFGRRDPASGRDQQTQYSAGARGFRARGAHIARRQDLSQDKLPYSPPVAPDSPAYSPAYDSYHDPNEDPSYQFGFRSAVHTRQEQADSRGHVDGRYSFVDDVGLRHVVEYEAGARTGFHVKTPHPDSNAVGGLFFRGPPASKTSAQSRGHTAVQRFKSGAYRFTAVGPDQRREEQSDAAGNVQGSYTYLDDKGVQRTTRYIAGPGIGYKVLKSPLDAPGGLPSLPSLPFHESPGAPAATDDDLFDLPGGLKTAATAAAVTSPGAGAGDDSDPAAGNAVDDEDIFGAKQPPPTPEAAHSSCCDAAGARRRHGLSSRQASRRIGPGDFAGFPAGVPVRAHVQSLDVSRRQLAPGEALERRPGA